MGAMAMPLAMFAGSMAAGAIMGKAMMPKIPKQDATILDKAEAENKPTEMPSVSGSEVEEQKRRSMAEQMARRGRQSTILSKNSESAETETLGG